MATAPQLVANCSNAQHSTGPRSDAGKAASARNATRHGLFAAAGYVPESEREQFEELETLLRVDLVPDGAMETVWFQEVVSAAWRLQRCLQREGDESAESAVQRARAQAQNQLVRATTELRRLQTERQLRNEVFPEGTDISTLGVASFKEVLSVIRRMPTVPDLMSLPPFAERTQIALPPAPPSERPALPPVAERTQLTPRNAPCPCGSGEKFKRCCGRNAPAVLNNQGSGVAR